MLETSFTGAVIVRPDQAAVDRGAYHYVRHPSYTAGAILFFGIGLALANSISLVVLMGAVAIVYRYRLGVEERALLETIGSRIGATWGARSGSCLLFFERTGTPGDLLATPPAILTLDNDERRGERDGFRAKRLAYLDEIKRAVG